MKKNILVGIIIALISIIVIILIAGGVIAWYFLRGNTNLINLIPSGTSTTSQEESISTPFGTVTPTQVNQAYTSLTQEQRDCLVNAVGQAKIDGFLSNDPAVLQTITMIDYAKAAACQK